MFFGYYHCILVNLLRINKHKKLGHQKNIYKLIITHHVVFKNIVGLLHKLIKVKLIC